MDNYLVRGIILGGSVGVLAAVMGFTDDIARAFGVGMFAGALAGLTMQRRANRVNKAKTKPE